MLLGDGHTCPYDVVNFINGDNPTNEVVGPIPGPALLVSFFHIYQ